MPQTVIFEVLDNEDQSHYLTLVRAISGTYAITGGTVFVSDPSGGDFTITLPSASSNTGRLIVVKHVGATGVLTVNSASGTIDGETSLLITQQWSAVHFVSDGANWVIV